ncbi:hypothetical protein PF004_g19786 [Phytophthora fragariae]|uniref:Uncharacterized protein n=1 Tax=Phytophthora fragariae TaxID=53985 RepID=A0A6G0N8G8_9STRA|nr:hypothetical protein PF004_g19786 [Phytophthora fragariae]
MPDALLSGIAKLLDEKGIGTGAMRKEELESTIRNLLNAAGLYQRSSVQRESQPETCSGTIIYWQRDGKFHRLPESFEFPDVDALGVWHLWWFGNPAMGYLPFKGLQPSDFSTTIKRKRYSEWTVLVKHLSDAVKAATNRDFHPPQNQHEADELFNIAMKNVPMKSSAEEKKSRRTDRAATTLRRIREALHEANSDARTMPFRRRKRRATNKLND